MRQGDTPAAVNAWTRSANSGNSNNFCLVNTDGTPNNNNADNSRALAPGFYRSGLKADARRVSNPYKRRNASLGKIPKTAH